MLTVESEVKKNKGWEFKEQRMSIDTGDKVNDINIQDAVIHILDSNGDEPILNEYKLELNEDAYKFLYKHIEKCFKDEELKYAVFNPGRNIVKESVQDYLNKIGGSELIGLSQDLARQLFIIMKGNVNIPSCDLMIVSLITDQGPMIGILKMDYVKNFTHKVEFVENKLGIYLDHQVSGLPGSSQRIQKAAFIRPIREDNKYDLMVIDKQRKNKNQDEYGANYFTEHFLGCSLIPSERDMTKTLLNVTENWTRTNITEDAAKAEKIRRTVKCIVEKDECVKINDLANKILDKEEEKEDFSKYAKAYGLEEEITIDKEYVEKKLKKVRIKIDRDIDLYIDYESYKDNSKFGIVKNGDGSINIVLKNIINYIEK